MSGPDGLGLGEGFQHLLGSDPVLFLEPGLVQWILFAYLQGVVMGISVSSTRGNTRFLTPCCNEPCDQLRSFIPPHAVFWTAQLYPAQQFQEKYRINIQDEYFVHQPQMNTWEH